MEPLLIIKVWSTYHIYTKRHTTHMILLTLTLHNLTFIRITQWVWAAYEHWNTHYIRTCCSVFLLVCKLVNATTAQTIHLDEWFESFEYSGVFSCHIKFLCYMLFLKGSSIYNPYSYFIFLMTDLGNELRLLSLISRHSTRPRDNGGFCTNTKYLLG